MELVGYAGPETGRRGPQGVRADERRLPVRRQGWRSSPDSPLLDHHRRHGDGVADIASRCPTWTVRPARRAPRARTVVVEPHDKSDEHGTVRIRHHRGVRRHRAHPGGPLPLRRRLPARATSRATAGFVERPGAPRRLLLRPSTTSSATSSWARWTTWVGFYHRVMGFTNMAEFIGDDIATDYSALMSKVVANGNHRVKFPLNEPAVGKRKSQIDEFLEFYARARRPAPRPGHQRHPRHGGRDARGRRGVPGHPGLLLLRPGAARPDRHGPGADRGAADAAASWSTGTRTAICCRSSPSRSATGPRCSSR